VTTDQPPDLPGGAPGACKRPGCGRPLPPPGLGRARQFCSQDCARGYHNAARYSTAADPAAADGGDPLAALETLTRQAATLISQARAEAGRLDPARVRVVLAEAEAARQRAEASTVTAQAQAAEAAQEASALAEALEAARAAQHAAETAAQTAAAAARAAEAGAQAARQAAAGQITTATTEASGRVTAAEQAAARCQRDRDAATEAARQARHQADTEISRARQAEADARAETGHVRADAARERDAFREHYQAQALAAETLTAAERARADRAEHQLDTELAAFRALATGHAQDTPTAGRPGSPGDPEPQPRRKARPASPQP
jgi:trimeric autotransporter adhesin